MQRCPREREARCLQVTTLSPGHLIYIPHFLDHALLTFFTHLPKILSGWDATTATNQQKFIQSLDEYAFCVRRSKWSEFFTTKYLSALRE